MTVKFIIVATLIAISVVMMLIGLALILGTLLRRERITQSRPVLRGIDGRKVEPVKPLDEVRCTYCGGVRFFEGPAGGMMQNIICVNEDCRHWFNVCEPLGIFDDLHKQSAPNPSFKATPRPEDGMYSL